MKKILSVIAITIGCLLVLGSAGSLEFNSIDSVRFILQSIIGVGLTWGGFLGLEKSNDK